MDARTFWILTGVVALVVVLHGALDLWDPPAAAAISLAVGVAAAAWLARLRARALARAVDAARNISAGELRRQLPETTRGALGDLYRSLNRLAEEFRRRLDEIEAEKAETDTLLREMGEGVLALSPSGLVVRANSTLRSAIGGARRIEGQSLAILFRNPALVEFLQPEGVPPDGKEAEFEVFGRTMLVSARRLPSAGVVAVFSDLTSIRKLQRVRTEFVANASHELKTPLTAVRGYAETLLDDSVEPGDRRAFARRIVEHATRMSAIVDDLLTLARLEEPGHRVARAAVPLRPLAQCVWAGLQGMADGVDFRMQIEPEDLVARADPEGLRQIVENLLDNAIRHSGAEAIGLRAVREGDDRVRITVWDHGRGIPSAHIERIFERFYRVDPSRSRASGGTGLGLAIVKHWAEVMGGSVRAESRVGEGTEMHVMLPGMPGPDRD